MSMKPEALIFADDRPTSVCDDLYQWAIDAEDLIRRMQAENEDLRDTVQFVERWAVHHGTKGCMSATETLSAIQHYPGITEVTDGYADGKRPATFNPYARIKELESAAQASLPQGWKLVPAEPTENMYLCVGYYKDDPAIAKRVIRRDYQAMLAAAPQPPEAAKHCDTPNYCQSVQRCTAMDEKRAGAAPGQMPEPAGCVVYANGESHHWDANRECAELFASSERSRGAPYAFTFENLYTEQQVRQLLAAKVKQGG